MTRRLRIEPLEDRLVPAAIVPPFVLDDTFGTDGAAFVSPELGPLYGAVADLEVDATGRLWVLGSVAGIAVLARFRPDGSPDATFDGDGVRSFGPWSEEYSSLSLGKLALLPDGRAVVAGQISRNFSYPAPALLPPYYGDSDLLTMRLNADGSLDASYGDGGRAVHDLDGGPAIASLQALTLLADGGLMVGGVQNYGYYPVYSNSDALSVPFPSLPRVVVAKLTAAGALDPAYDGDGVATLAARDGAFEQFAATTIDAAGRATVLGTRTDSSSTRAFATAYRFDAAGALDANFDGDGYAETLLGELGPIPDGATGSFSASGVFAAAQPDGGVVSALNTYRSEYRNDPYFSKGRGDLILVRFANDGSVDPAFGTNGRVVRTLSEFDSTNSTPSTSRFAVGLQGFADGSLALLEQYTPLTTFVDPIVSTVPTIAITSLIRYDAAGRPLGDATRGPEFAFPTDGPKGTNVQPREIAFDAAGRLLAAGVTDTSTVTGTRIGVARLTPTEPPADILEQTILVAHGGAVRAVQVDGAAPAIVGPAERPFGDFDGEVVARLADLDGDGRVDELFGIGAGGGSIVLARFHNADGSTDTVRLDAFEAAFRGGVALSVGDLDGDGAAEVVVSAGNGGGGRVQIFSVARTGFVKRADFFGIDDDRFRGGASTALADLNADGRPELLVAAGVGGGPRVAVFDGASLLAPLLDPAPPRLRNDFFAFGGDDAARLRNGVNIEAADLNGDGRVDLIFGAGAGGARRVLAIDGARYLDGETAALVNFYVDNDDARRSGVRVAVKDIDQDGRADLVVEHDSQLRIYDGARIVAAPGAEPAILQDLVLFADGVEGVFVG